MVRFISFFIVGLWFLATSAQAVEITVTDTLVLDINLKEGWTLHLEPPEALVAEMAAHVAHEPAAANASIKQVEKVTRKRMAANEAFIYHAASGAHLDIDFSPLGPDSSAPSAQTLRNSAEFAAQSLEGDEGVTETTGKVTTVTIDGAGDVALLTAEYRRHDLPMVFYGYIGFVAKHWFFLYFTAPGNDPGLLQEMQSMIDLMVIRTVIR